MRACIDALIALNMCSSCSEAQVPFVRAPGTRPKQSQRRSSIGPVMRHTRGKSSCCRAGIGGGDGVRGGGIDSLFDRVARRLRGAGALGGAGSGAAAVGTAETSRTSMPCTARSASSLPLSPAALDPMAGIMKERRRWRASCETHRSMAMCQSGRRKWTPGFSGNSTSTTGGAHALGGRGGGISSAKMTLSCARPLGGSWCVRASCKRCCKCTSFSARCCSRKMKPGSSGVGAEGLLVRRACQKRTPTYRIGPACTSARPSDTSAWAARSGRSGRSSRGT